MGNGVVGLDKWMVGEDDGHMPTPQTLTAEQMTDARDWLADCFDDMPNDCTDDEIVRAVSRHYDGGIEGFIADGNYPT